LVSFGQNSWKVREGQSQTLLVDVGRMRLMLSEWDRVSVERLSSNLFFAESVLSLSYSHSLILPYSLSLSRRLLRMFAALLSSVAGSLSKVNVVVPVRWASKYKLKTHKGCSKRFIPINNGNQFKRSRSHKAHLNYGKTTSSEASVRNNVTLSKSQLRAVKRLIPYA